MTTETPTDALREPLPLADVNLADLDRFTDGVTPWRMFHTLRHQDPVHWQPEEAPNSGFWAVTRHRDIVRVDRDPETFTSTRFVNLEEVDDDQIKKRASILELDGVRHRALRSLIQRQFGANVISGYTDFLRGLTARTLDTALAKGRFDFVEDVSADFPINVLARLLDVPPEDNQRLIDWGNRIIGHTDPDYADVLLHSEESERYRDLPFRSPPRWRSSSTAGSWRGGDAAATAPTWSPGWSTPPPGRCAALPAGLRQLLPAPGRRRQRDHPAHHLPLDAGPDPAPRAAGPPPGGPLADPGRGGGVPALGLPVYHFRRTATRDVELGGRRVREGDKVVMWFASGNRDEEVFGDPYDFDVTRADNDHVTFGKGSPHLCLGNLLARTEIRIMFEELIPRLADIRLAGDVPRVRSNFVNGIKKLPVEVTLT